MAYKNPDKNRQLSFLNLRKISPPFVSHLLSLIVTYCHLLYSHVYVYSRRCIHSLTEKCTYTNIHLCVLTHIFTMQIKHKKVDIHTNKGSSIFKLLE